MKAQTTHNYKQQFDDIKSQLILHKARFESLLNQEATVQQALSEHTLKSSQLSSQIKTLNDAIKVFQELMDKVSLEQIEELKSILNYALSVIFEDEQYEIAIEVIDKRSSKTAELFLIQHINGSLRTIPFNDSIGGGVISIIGFVLQVYYLTVFKHAPIIFLDEAFSQVSSKYIPSLLQFIKELALKYDFIVVLISHSEQIITDADRIFRVSKGAITRIQ